MLITEGLRWAESALEESGVLGPRLESEVFLAEILSCDRAYLYAHPENPLSEEAKETLSVWVTRRSQGLPLAYILGKKEFWSLEFRVTPAVLIPRPETELLVEISIRKAREEKAKRIAEVGCGSGAVIVSLARELVQTEFYGTDACREALGIARLNARSHGVEDRISFHHGDLLGPLEGRSLEGKLDQVVSNPPYVPRDEISRLSPDIRLYEPRRALDGGRDGLFIYGRLIPQTKRFLKPGGWLFLEVGDGQGEAVSMLLAKTKGFEPAVLAFDGQGRERVLFARRKKLSGPPQYWVTNSRQGQSTRRSVAERHRAKAPI